MTIEEFIRARLDEDEADAASAMRGPRRPDWSEDYGQEFIVVVGVRDGVPDCVVRSTDESRHIARHDPARVLRQVAAHRVALSWYLDDDDVVMGPTIRAIAAIWSDHPDYRPEWTV